MDRRLFLSLALTIGCAKGSLEGPTSFGTPTGATQASNSNGDDSDSDDEDTDDENSDGGSSTGTNSGGEASTAAAEDGSTSSPASGAEESSEDSANPDPSQDASAGGESSSTDPTDASASAGEGDGGANDDGAVPPPDAGPWQNCQAATCEVGTDCITVNGIDADAYCSPQCVTDLDCPAPDSGDATPYCLLVAEGAVDPTNCTLVCEVDGLDYGTCPNGMSCTSIPGQDPSISLCMW